MPLARWLSVCIAPRSLVTIWLAEHLNRLIDTHRTRVLTTAGEDLREEIVSGTELVTNADAADPLRIVLVAPPYFDIPPKGYGGVEVVVADLANALVQRGHDVTVLGAGEPRTSARLIPVWERTLADRLGEPYPEIMHALKVRRVIERPATTDGADIVHDHTFAGPRSTAVSASRRATLRQILRERSNVAEPTPA